MQIEHDEPKDNQKFDTNGSFITKWGTFGSGNGQFYPILDIAVDSSGYV